MSQFGIEFTKQLENILTALVSLRVFVLRLGGGGRHSHLEEIYLPLTVKISDQAPHIEYFALIDSSCHYWKQVRGGLEICDEAEYPFPPLRFI